MASLTPAADGSPAVIAGRYELRDLIGRGAFGEVFEAYDRVLGRLVAVKVMPLARDLGPEGRESLRRFQFEARAVSRLKHPNIITVHDFGQGERFAWIVMELVIGETLTAALKRSGPPPIAETSRVICALLGALHAAHERGIVHRDVKPGNILLEMSLEDGLGEVRLSDFGIALTDAEDRTVTGQIMGTPWVMAPEQLRGESVDRRTDLWAVGVILYNMLTGERPFSGTVPAIFHQIQTEDPKPPVLLRAELQGAVDGLIARALAKAPEDRFATAEEMAGAVRDALSDKSRWKDGLPLPGLGPEDPRPRVPVSPVAAAQPPSPARARVRWAVTFGLMVGFLLGVATNQIASFAPGLLAETRAGTSAAGDPQTVPAALLAAAPSPSHPDDSMPEPVAEAPEHGATTFTDGGASPMVAGVELPEALPTMVEPPEPEPMLPAAALSTAPTDLPQTEAPVTPERAEPPPVQRSLQAEQTTLAQPVTGDQTPPMVAIAPDNPAAPTVASPHAMDAPMAGQSSRTGDAGTRALRPNRPAAAPHAPPILPVCGPGRLRIRTGSHEGFGRIVFEWSGTVEYRVRQGDSGIVVSFPDAGCQPSPNGIRPTRNLRGVEAEGGSAAGLLLRIAAGVQPQDFRLGVRVVIDLADPRSE